MEDNVKSFLDKIQELKEKKIKVSVLSTGKEIDCSILTFKQQKDLISTIADGATSGLKFQKILNDILLENTKFEGLRTTDKIPIIIKLKMDSLGGTTKIKETEIPLAPILKKAEKMKFKSTKTINDVVNVEVEVPTLVQENKIITAAIETLKKDSENEYGKSIGNIYTYEIVKHIKQISFGSDGDVLVFEDLPVRDRFKVVENLPLSVNKSIIEFIQNIKRKETEVLTVSVDGEEKVLDIDVSFFDT